MDISTRRVGGARLQSDGLLHRQRLMSRLEEKSPLTIVRGPAGSGKSTLVEQYVEQYPVAGVFISVDYATSTRRGFWQETLNALMEDAPQLSAGAGREGSAGDLRRLLAETFTVAQAELLVIDSIDECDRSAEIECDVFQLLQDCPSLRVIVTTRTRGYLEGGLVGAKVSRTLISPLTLMLTQEESSQMISPVLDMSFDVVELHQLCGASPLLLRAMVVGLQHRVPGETIDQVAFRVVRDLMLNAEQDRMNFMVRTCVTEKFDPMLVSRLTADPLAMDTLNDLVDEGLLVREDTSDGPLCGPTLK